MRSDPTRAYVWVWLPGSADPVVAGRLDRDGTVFTFTYGRSYLDRADAIPLSLPELALGDDPIWPTAGKIAGCVADSSPDAWGRRVIMNRRVGHGAQSTADIDEVGYLLESGSDRIGALDFQTSPSEYVARSRDGSLDELARSAERVELGIPLSPDLDAALLHGSSIGGARPKAILHDGDRQVIAKFSATTDTTPIVKAEFVAMELARRAGLDVARVALTRAMGNDVLLVDRFDRPGNGHRRLMLSALTILGLDELGARHASYADLAHQIRARFTTPDATLRELFSRIAFNLLVGNNDDHARNHAAFWDGRMLTLTPAYDICPQPRTGNETAQAMAIGDDGFRMSQLVGLRDRASTYHLTKVEATEIIDHQLDVIRTEWVEVCDLAALTEVDRAGLWHRQFLNPYTLDGY